MCDNIVEEFRRLNDFYISPAEKKLIRDAKIYDIGTPYPGFNYKTWRSTETATFYVKGALPSNRITNYKG